MIGLALGAHDVAAADGAMLGHVEHSRAARMVFVFDDLHDFRNDVAAALDFDLVADLHAEFVDEVHVVQCGAARQLCRRWGPA